MKRNAVTIVNSTENIPRWNAGKVDVGWTGTAAPTGVGDDADGGVRARAPLGSGDSGPVSDGEGDESGEERVVQHGRETSFIDDRAAAAVFVDGMDVDAFVRLAGEQEALDFNRLWRTHRRHRGNVSTERALEFFQGARAATVE